MWPYDIALGPLAVNLYGIMTALGAVLGLWILRFTAPPAGLSVRFARDLAFWALLWGLAGSRAAYVATHWPDFSGRPWRIPDFWGGGLMFQGGLLGGFLAVVMALRGRGVTVLAAGDALAPALSLGQGMGRAGCLFAGCCHGRPAPPGFPLALVFPEGSAAPAGIPLYPVEAAEGLGLLALTASLVWLCRVPGRPRGLPLGGYLLGAGLLRLVMECFRGDFRGRPVLGIPPTSWAAVAVALCGAAVIWRIIRDGKPPVSRPGEGRETGGRGGDR